MDRLACVDVRALSLQLLLRERPDWAAHPTAVVEQERPQGVILSVNEPARRRRVLPGMRHAAGLALAADLRAARVPPETIDEAVRELTSLLHDFSPGVEPGTREPGLFWLDASGLQRLHPCLETWARSILDAVQAALQLQAAAAVGFSRFGCYALARTTAPGRVRLCSSLEQEQRLTRAVPLDRLVLQPRLRHALHQLGVDSVGALLRLPPGGLLERFGPEAHTLHAMASGRQPAPLQPAPQIPALRQRVDLDHPEREVTRLLFLIKHRLHGLLAELARRGQALVALQLSLEIDPVWQPGAGDHADRPLQQHTLRPAEPTLDSVQLADLVRLRLEAASRQGLLGRGVTAVELSADGAAASREQLQLFVQRPRRDLAAANRALARLRAELGQQAVVHAVLQDRHLPEASFAFEPLSLLRPPRPDPSGKRLLVRRLLSTALTLQRKDPSRWVIDGEPAEQAAGPHILSGGWWGGSEVHREYHYVRTRQGDLLWLYHDRQRGRWVLQGKLE